MDLFANRAKLNRCFGLLRMFSATRLEAVPTGVAIPPIPVPTASAQASGAMATPGVLAIAAITGMKTVASGTLSTTCEINAVTHRTRVTESARFPPETWIISLPSIERTPVLQVEQATVHGNGGKSDWRSVLEKLVEG